MSRFYAELGRSSTRARLRNTRWPEHETVDERMNAWPQFTTRHDDLDIHFVHARSPEPDAVPLVMTHGWPPALFVDEVRSSFRGLRKLHEGMHTP